jgi:hypothetical protein
MKITTIRFLADEKRNAYVEALVAKKNAEPDASEIGMLGLKDLRHVPILLPEKLMLRITPAKRVAVKIPTLVITHRNGKKCKYPHRIINPTPAAIRAAF